MNTLILLEKLSIKDRQENIFIRENKKPYTKHDLLFKQLIQTFFKEFLEAFFPEVYEKIDFQTVKFLSE